MPLLNDSDLVRIDLPAEGEFVMVKRKLSRGDRIAVQMAVTKGGKVVPGESIEYDMPTAWDAAEFAVLDLAIKAMCVSVREGSPPETVEVTPKAIRELDDASVDCIKAKMEELYPAPLSEEERRNLNGVGARLRKAKASPPPN